MTLDKAKDIEPMKTFLSGQSSIMNEHKTKDWAELWPISTSVCAPFSAPLKFAEFHNHSPLCNMLTCKNIPSIYFCLRKRLQAVQPLIDDFLTVRLTRRLERAVYQQTFA